MKKITLLILGMLALNSMSAQHVKWVNTAGGATFDNPYQVATDMQGNTYVTGGYNRFGNAGDTSAYFGGSTITGRDNMYLSKFDSAGNFVWTQTAKSTGSDLGVALTTDNFGNIYVLGETNPINIQLRLGNVMLPLITGPNYLVKYNSNGAVRWAKNFAGGTFMPVTTDPQGNIYLAGSSQDFDVYVGNMLGVNPGSNLFYFVAKLDSSGNGIWLKTGGNQNSSQQNDVFAAALDIEVDAQGNSYVAGLFAGTIQFDATTVLTSNPNTISENFLAKYDTQGNLVYAKVFSDGHFLTLDLDSAGNIYLPAEEGPSLSPNLKKLDASGNVLWKKPIQISSTNDINALGITVDAAGNGYFTGEFFDSISVGGESVVRNGWGQFIFKFDSFGSVYWGRSFGDIYAPAGIELLPSGDPVTAGGIVAGSIIGEDTMDAFGWIDIFVARVEDTFSVSPPVSRSIADSVCSGDAYFFGNRVLTSSGVYFDTIEAATGGDTIATLTLSVLSSPEPLITSNGGTLTTGNFSAYQWLRDGVPVSNATNQQFQPVQGGSYRVVVTGANGCSGTSAAFIVTPGAVFTSVSDTICSGETYLFGSILLSAAGVYADTLTASSGSDSIVTLTLTVASFSSPVITQNGNILSTGSFSVYQWMLNGDIVGNATGQSYQVVQNGNYRVIVTDSNGCRDTSAIFTLTNVGVANVSAGIAVTLHPNPNTGVFTLQFTDDKERMLAITDMVGKSVIREMPVRRNHHFTLAPAPGIYFLRVREEGKVSIVKFVVRSL